MHCERRVASSVERVCTSYVNEPMYIPGTDLTHILVQGILLQIIHGPGIKHLVAHGAK